MNFPDFNDLAPERDRQFVSIGGLCQILQVLPGQVKVLCADTGVQFAMLMDGVPYFTSIDAEKLAERCAELRKEIQSVADSAASN